MDVLGNVAEPVSSSIILNTTSPQINDTNDKNKPHQETESSDIFNWLFSIVIIIIVIVIIISILLIRRKAKPSTVSGNVVMNNDMMDEEGPLFSEDVNIIEDIEYAQE